MHGVELNVDVCSSQPQTPQPLFDYQLPQVLTVEAFRVTGYPKQKRTFFCTPLTR